MKEHFLKTMAVCLALSSAIDAAGANLLDEFSSARAATSDSVKQRICNDKAGTVFSSLGGQAISGYQRLAARQFNSPVIRSEGHPEKHSFRWYHVFKLHNGTVCLMNVQNYSLPKNGQVQLEVQVERVECVDSKRRLHALEPATLSQDIGCP